MWAHYTFVYRLEVGNFVYTHAHAHWALWPLYYHSLCTQGHGNSIALANLGFECIWRTLASESYNKRHINVLLRYK